MQNVGLGFPLHARRAKKILPPLLAASALLGAYTLGQQEIVSPQQAVRMEQTTGTFIQQGNGVAPTDFLQMIYQCTRAVGDILEINGFPYFRVYEFDLINPTVYRLQGIQAISNAIRRAEAKARGSAVKMMVGVATTVREIVADVNKQAASASATSTGKEEAIVSAVTTENLNVFASVTENSASGFLKGGRVTGTRIISLGDAGICVMVRFDVPLKQTEGANPSSPSGGGSGSGSGQNPGGAPPIPPGKAGDF
jgi:hypothetical protein